jgi:hypothetical protein
MPAISDKRAAHIQQSLRGSRFREGEEDAPALLENSSLLSVCDPVSGGDLLQPVLVMKATEKSCEAGLDVLGRGPAVSIRRDTQRRGLI